MSYHLRLCKSLSYKGIVSATKKQPDVFVEDKATADAAVATGYFILIENEDESKTEPGPEKISYSKEQLADMKVEQLKAIAEKAGIAEAKTFKKTDYINAILWAQNDYSNGSPTMIALQEE